MNRIRSIAALLFTLVSLTGCAIFRHDRDVVAVPEIAVTNVEQPTVDSYAESDEPVATNVTINEVEPPRNTALTAEERSARKNAVDVHTDRGRAYGRALRPGDLKTGQEFVVPVTDNLYGTSRQLKAGKHDASKLENTEVIPSGGRLGRFDSNRVYVATRTPGAPKPLPGVPDKHWDYTSICTPECGCQPVNLAAWQLQDPPPLMVVTSSFALDVMDRLGRLEGQVREVRADVANIKALSVQTLPATRSKKGVQTGGLVSGGRGAKTCRVFWGSDGDIRDAYDRRAFDSADVQMAETTVIAGPHRQQFALTADMLEGGSVLAACRDEAGTLAFGRPLDIPGGSSIWSNPMTWLGIGAGAGLLYWLSTRGDDEPEGGPGMDPLPMSLSTNAVIDNIDKQFRPGPGERRRTIVADGLAAAQTPNSDGVRFARPSLQESARTAPQQFKSKVSVGIIAADGNYGLTASIRW